ncbi:MAG TPA: hypothetical protein VGV15_10440, partial [Terriglobales bacterium]|nr:hypothetical protein [Terriglobales bacterium]
AGSVGFVVSSVVAGGSYLSRLWLGGANLGYTIYFTLPFAFLLGSLAAAMPFGSFTRKHRAIIVSAGAILGFFYTYALFRFVVPGFLAILIQTLSCWVAGGISAMLALTVTGLSRKILSIASACLLAILLPKPIFDALAHNQQLTVAFVARPADGEDRAHLRVVGIDAKEVNAVRAQILKDVSTIVLDNDFRIVHLSRQGEGRESLAIVIVRSPVEKRTSLPEPDASTVIYVQQSKEWIKHPSDARTLRRNIEIWPSSEGTESALFSIPSASGVSLLGAIPKTPREH